MSSNAAGLISRSEKQFILEGCRENCRQDGRSRDETRSYCIVSNDAAVKSAGPQHEQQPPLVLSNGSARLLLPTGETDLICSVRAELVQPAMLEPKHGVLEIHVDTTERNTRNNYFDELECTLSRLLLAHLVQVEQLCVAPSHFAWRLHIDLLIVAASGGSLLDACSLVIRAALRNVKLPRVSVLARNESTSQGSENRKPELQVDADIASAKPLPGLERVPEVVTVTVLRCQSHVGNNVKPATILVLDATLEEEACAFAQIHIAVDRSMAGEPTICALHKAGGGSLPFGLLQDVTAMALKTAIPTVTAEHAHHLLQDQFLLEQ